MRSLICLLAIAGSLGAQVVPPGRGWGIIPQAKVQLDSMAARTAATHTEQMMCITTSLMQDTTYIIAALRPAKHVVKSDSLNVWTDGPMCEDWQPNVHSHIVPNQWWPWATPVDTHTAVVRGVFGFLMSVKPDSTWTLKAYP